MSNDLLIRTAQTALRHRETLLEGPVMTNVSHDDLLSTVRQDLPDDGETPELAIQALIDSAKRGLIGSVNPRYFGFVKAGICWIGTTVWQRQAALRVSVSNSLTSQNDVTQSLQSIKESLEEELQRV